jgi:hypothetical protein
MNPLYPILVLALLTTTNVCEAANTQPTDPDVSHERSAAVDGAGEANPMASFAIMEEGQWDLGSIHADTWRWGPGKHSIRSHTVGTDASGRPWREMAIYYWHPGLEQIRVLSLHPDIPGIGRGVAEGSIEFDGRTLTGQADLYQTGRQKPTYRRLAHRWTFNGPDRYHEVLLENSGRGYQTLAEWDYVRTEKQPSTQIDPEADAPLPSENLTSLVPLLGQWESLNEQGHERDDHTRLNFEWAEYLDLIAVRLDSADHEETDDPLCDAYLFHHVGTNTLRCLALTRSGLVYEGDITQRTDGSLQCELTCIQDDLETKAIARLEIERDGSLRVRIWTAPDEDRPLIHDARYQRVGANQE